MKKVVLLTGGNLGDIGANMASVVGDIGRGIGRVVKKSSVYTSEAWGFEASEKFLNQALVCQTELSPRQVLEKIHAIEARYGRTRTGNGYASRTMDIDILFFGSETIDTPDLKIPHPLLHLRGFVLAPLAEIMGSYVHPALGKTIDELKDSLCRPL